MTRVRLEVGRTRAHLSRQLRGVTVPRRARDVEQRGAGLKSEYGEKVPLVMRSEDAKFEALLSQ